VLPTGAEIRRLRDGLGEAGAMLRRS
jgi:hypothetical protein